MTGRRSIPGVRLYARPATTERIGVVSFVIDGMTTSKTGLLLDRRYAIMSRIGLHCAPIAHRTLGTFPDGTVRFGFGYFNTPEEVDHALDAIGEMAHTARNQSEGAHV